MNSQQDTKKILSEIAESLSLSETDLLKMITLWNQELFEGLRSRLKEQVSDKKMTEETFTKSMKTLETLRDKAIKSRSEYHQNVENTYQEALSDFLKEEIERKKKRIAQLRS